jgi:tyrosinase
VVQSGGPSTWALPYWNYLDSNSGQLQMPPALSAKNLPDGSLNPLFVTARYGVRGNGNIVILSPPVNQNCQQAPAYTNNYGGGVTGFAHFAGGTGALESNPHSIVHGQIGGNSNTTPYYGLMSDPGLAALDPVFYLHHCNIDRLWAHWNNSGHQNPTDANWLNGPTASGQRKFYMPKPDGSAWNYTPGMVNTISQLGYTYSDLPAQSSAKEYSVIKTRLLNLTKTLSKKSIMPVQLDDTAELVGASRKSVKLGSTGAQAPVKLDSKVNAKLKKSLVEASESRLPDDVFLLLEGIKGTADSNMYSVAVNQHYVGHFSLFGIRKASMNDGHHAGSGLHVKFDISSLVDELHLNAGLPEKLDVQIVPDGQLLKNGGKITIDRISVYRLPNK